MTSANHCIQQSLINEDKEWSPGSKRNICWRKTAVLLDGKNRTKIAIVLLNIPRKVKNFGKKWKKAYNWQFWFGVKTSKSSRIDFCNMLGRQNNIQDWWRQEKENKRPTRTSDSLKRNESALFKRKIEKISPKNDLWISVNMISSAIKFAREIIFKQ